MRVHNRHAGGSDKHNFRAYHITKITIDGPAPRGREYSHRCHEPRCVNTVHGVWEHGRYNKDREGCINASHLILPDLTIIRLCPHDPVCLTPIHIRHWDDRRIINI